MSYKDKSSAMSVFLDMMALHMFGRRVGESIDAGVCVRCGHPVLESALDEEDAAKYEISGLCPECFEETTGDLG